MTLTDEERELLSTEVAQALEQVRSPEARVRYGELLSAVDAGEVPDDLLESLQGVLEVGLESGRIRRVHTAHGEMIANRVFARTPRGRMLHESAGEVNNALAALEGHALRELKITPAGPGAWAIHASTDQGTLLIRLSRQGARLQSVEVG